MYKYIYNRLLSLPVRTRIYEYVLVYAWWMTCMSAYVISMHYSMPFHQSSLWYVQSTKWYKAVQRGTTLYTAVWWEFQKFQTGLELKIFCILSTKHTALQVSSTGAQPSTLGYLSLSQHCIYFLLNLSLLAADVESTAQALQPPPPAMTSPAWACLDLDLLKAQVRSRASFCRLDVPQYHEKETST